MPAKSDHLESNQNWHRYNRGQKPSAEQVAYILLMDIRAELREINESLKVLRCQNFIGIPEVLRRISANTHKPKRKRQKPR